MIDVHCHLTDTKYTQDEGVSAADRACKAGIEMITNGTSTDDSQQAAQMAEKHDGVWACVGVAYEAGCANIENTMRNLEVLCDQPRVVGIGESGLNYYSGMTEELKIYQLALFKMHLQLAIKFSLPIQIHNRNADREVMDILFDQGNTLKNKVLLHCFSGSTEFMKQMADWGCYFSFGGMVTYKKNQALRETLYLVPEDRLLLETDSPYLPPEPHRGTRNEPINVKIVAEKVAEIKGVSRERIEELIQLNSRRLFSKLNDQKKSI